MEEPPIMEPPIEAVFETLMSPHTATSDPKKLGPPPADTEELDIRGPTAPSEEPVFNLNDIDPAPELIRLPVDETEEPITAERIIEIPRAQLISLATEIDELKVEGPVIE